MNVVCDDYIDLTFGTGVMKCTPAHDFNDYLLAKKHNLELISERRRYIKWTMCWTCWCWSFSCKRELIVKKFQSEKIIDRIQEYETTIGFSERTNEIVEPYLSKQWFIKMEPLTKAAINQQLSDHKVNFYLSHALIKV